MYNSHQPYTRTPHSHHTYTNKPTTTLRSNRVLREITGSIQDSVGDGRVAIPLWLHAWKATKFNREPTVPGGKSGTSSARIRDRWPPHLESAPTELRLGPSSTSLLFARAACFYATTVRSSSQFKAHENGGTCVEGATVWTGRRLARSSLLWDRSTCSLFSSLFSFLFAKV